MLGNSARILRHGAATTYRQVLLNRRLPAFRPEGLVPVEQATDVLLLCSRLSSGFDPQACIAERAFSHEMAAGGRVFSVADEPSALFDKSIMWFLPSRFVSPRLWDYSRQVHEFAASLERQGNRLLCSSEEVMYWENKAYMHRGLSEVGAPTPRTLTITSEASRSARLEFEPVLVKEEHSAGSAGVHYFERAADAREFLRSYPFRPTESLIVQEIVRGATRDLRLTMVGDRMIRSASFWRTKNAEALAASAWTTTATKYGSTVKHGEIPAQAVEYAVELLQKLGLRMAGIDLMWVDDDISDSPLILEVSPYFQPNPPKPERYAEVSYKHYKQKPYAKDGYFAQQYMAFKEIARAILDQGLF